MERLQHMKDVLIDCVQSQIYSNIDKVDTKELGEAIDMIKDLSEAIYYCTITEAMEEGAEEKEGKHHVMYMSRSKYPYESDERYPRPGHDWKTPRGDMPRTEYPSHREGVWGKDPDEGRSGERRKMYMKGKMDNDKAHQMRELENYMSELAQDMTEMIQDASPEEKALLQQKITLLAQKIK